MEYPHCHVRDINKLGTDYYVSLQHTRGRGVDGSEVLYVKYRVIAGVCDLLSYVCNLNSCKTEARTLKIQACK